MPDSALNVSILEIGESSVAIARHYCKPNVPYNSKGFVTSRKDCVRARLLGKRIYTKQYA
ncbi:hypothetical protein [Halpernia sp. GG3]